jgi:arylsulfatase
VNGKKADAVEMPPMHISTYSLAETFDVGRDTGTQVSDLYTGIFKFNQELDRVIFRVSDDNTVPPRKLPAVYY